jgi:prevent-host-death family protein
MQKPNVALNLDVDLEAGVVPISKAASALASLLKRARERRQPIIVTQKGYPTGILLDIETYTALRDLALVNSAPMRLLPLMSQKKPSASRAAGERKPAGVLPAAHAARRIVALEEDVVGSGRTLVARR